MVDPQVGPGGHHPLPPPRPRRGMVFTAVGDTSPASQDGRNEEDAKKMLNFTSEARKSLKIKESSKKRAQNELVFARKEGPIQLIKWPRKRLLSGQHPQSATCKSPDSGLRARGFTRFYEASPDIGRARLDKFGAGAVECTLDSVSITLTPSSARRGDTAHKRGATGERRAKTEEGVNSRKRCFLTERTQDFIARKRLRSRPR